MDKSTQLKTLALLLACSGILFNPMGYANDSMMPSNQTTKTVAVNDQALRASLLSALSPYANQMTIRVTNGVAHLSGQLDSNTDYEKIVTVAESTDGIVDVNADNLKVKDSPSPLADTYTTAKVKGVLVKSDVMGKDIPAWSVHVETINGQVYLSGTVMSASEKEHIVSIVKSVKGVEKVVDKMSIASGTGE